MTLESIGEKIKNDQYVLCWGNNLVVKDTYHTNDLIESIIMMQFHYVELDILNLELREKMEVLQELTNIAYKSNYKELIKRKNEIIDMKKRVEYSIINFNDEIINLQSFKQFFHQKLINIWQIDILMSNINNKLEYCLNEVTKINSEITERSNFQADLLLFIIGLFGLLSYFLDLSQVIDSFNIVDENWIEIIFGKSTFGTLNTFALFISLYAVFHFILRRK